VNRARFRISERADEVRIQLSDIFHLGVLDSRRLIDTHRWRVHRALCARPGKARAAQIRCLALVARTGQAPINAPLR